MAEHSAEKDALERDFIAWLVETLHYPFDCTFDPPPPVDLDRLADYWNQSDEWNISTDEARATVRSEAFPPERCCAYFPSCRCVTPPASDPEATS